MKVRDSNTTPVIKYASRLIFFGLLVSVSSCTAVKEYQKIKLKDAEMELGTKKVQKTEVSFQTYREGASGGNGGKTGGGCGCN